MPPKKDGRKTSPRVKFVMNTRNVRRDHNIGENRQTAARTSATAVTPRRPTETPTTSGSGSSTQHTSQPTLQVSNREQCAQVSATRAPDQPQPTTQTTIGKGKKRRVRETVDIDNIYDATSSDSEDEPPSKAARTSKKDSPTNSKSSTKSDNRSNNSDDGEKKRSAEAKKKKRGAEEAKKKDAERAAAADVEMGNTNNSPPKDAKKPSPSSTQQSSTSQSRSQFNRGQSLRPLLPAAPRHSPSYAGGLPPRTIPTAQAQVLQPTASAQSAPNAPWSAQPPLRFRQVPGPRFIHYEHNAQAAPRPNSIPSGREQGIRQQDHARHPDAEHTGRAPAAQRSLLDIGEQVAREWERSPRTTSQQQQQQQQHEHQQSQTFPSQSQATHPQPQEQCTLPIQHVTDNTPQPTTQVSGPTRAALWHALASGDPLHMAHMQQRHADELTEVLRERLRRLQAEGQASGPPNQSRQSVATPANEPAAEPEMMDCDNDGGSDDDDGNDESEDAPRTIAAADMHLNPNLRGIYGADPEPFRATHRDRAVRGYSERLRAVRRAIAAPDAPPGRHSVPQHQHQGNRANVGNAGRSMMGFQPTQEEEWAPWQGMPTAEANQNFGQLTYPYLRHEPYPEFNEPDPGIADFDWATYNMLSAWTGGRHYMGPHRGNLRPSRRLLGPPRTALQDIQAIERKNSEPQTPRTPGSGLTVNRPMRATDTVDRRRGRGRGRGRRQGGGRRK